MDSVSQIALGSAVTMGIMGRRTAAWKAALWGGAVGTLPDLDVLIDHGDDLLNMVLHRAESHSLLFLSLLSPLLAWGVARLYGQVALFWHWTLALWAALFTHPLLDTMTVYGTQLLQPFSDYPYGVGSVFIIDPAYTVPLVMGVVIALCLQDDTRIGLRWNAAGLLLSTSYLAWSVAAQLHVERIAQASLQQAGIPAQGLLVTPTPFNTILWRLVAITPQAYHEGFYSLMDEQPTVRWTAYPRGTELVVPDQRAESVARLAAFSHGFYSLAAMPNGHLRITDLRMGQEPRYVFSFDLGPPNAVNTTPARQISQRPEIGPALRWLWDRLRGRDLAAPH